MKKETIEETDEQFAKSSKLYDKIFNDEFADQFNTRTAIMFWSIFGLEVVILVVLTRIIISLVV